MVQRAEDLVYELSQKRVRGDFSTAHDLVTAGIERLVAASDRGSEITGPAPRGTPTWTGSREGCAPANLVVVAARPEHGQDGPGARHGRSTPRWPRSARSRSSAWR